MMLLMLQTLCIVFLVSSGTALSSPTDCEQTVAEWAAQEFRQQDEFTQSFASESKQLTELLYFLHVPRTGGRTFYQCFLQNLYPKEQRCPRSYDKLRFNPRYPDCKLLTTHDDYSILTLLSKETSVVTNLRHPLDRVFSAYEFSIEVAARFLGIGRNQTIAEARSPSSQRSSSSPTSTLDIWPWKHLVPFMREDLFKRRDARNAKLMDIPTEIQNFYNVSSIAMPLHEFIQHPEVFELVHNGATFQVAGLTNNSFFKAAKRIRLCIQQYPELGIHALGVAKNRLSKMLYVGLTEKHEESAAAFASLVGAQALSQWATANESFENYLENQRFKQEKGYQVPSISSESRFIALSRQEQGLLGTYHSCVRTLRRGQLSRKRVSLKNITPIKYSPEMRTKVGNSLVEEILHLNSLDVKLYEYAVNIFQDQQASLMVPPRLFDGCPLCSTFKFNSSMQAWRFS